VTGEPAHPAIAGRLARFKPGPPVSRWLLLFAFLGLISPTVINYSPYPLPWDESYYLGRVICTNHAVYDFTLSRLSECLATTHKGPIMGLINLPWGRVGGTYRGIGLAFFGLALFVWILVLITYLTCLRAGIPPGSLLLAAATIGFTPFLRTSSGAMMTDTLLGWSIALALMLIPLEYSRPSHGILPSILRGLLWSVAVNVGMLSKVTFLFFLLAVGMSLLVIRTDHSGEKPVRYAFAGCLLGALATLIIWRYYGMNFMRFAIFAAWSGGANVWSVPGMTAAGYSRRYFSQLGFALIPLLILLGLFIRGIWIEKQMRLARLLPIGIILMYLGIAARSQNRDPRFSIPVMIAMPLCLAWTGFRKESKSTVGAAPMFTALLLGTLLALPMIRRPEVAPIKRAGELLRTLSQEQSAPGQSIKIVIATDGPEFNIDTFLLARQLGRESLQSVDLDTLVYDAINKRSLRDGTDRIDAADYVLFLRSDHTPGADWQRVWAQDYRSHAEKAGILLDSKTSPDMDVLKIRKAGVQ
jgi:hypothetical protein